MWGKSKKKTTSSTMVPMASHAGSVAIEAPVGAVADLSSAAAGAAMRLLDEHYRLVYGLCLRLSLDRAQACTLAHEAFLEYFARSRPAEGYGAQRESLYAEALRLADRSLPEGPIPITELLIQEEPEGKRWLFACLARLTLRERAAFLLKYYALYDEEHAARLLHLSLRDLNALLERAKVVMLPGGGAGMDGQSPSRDDAIDRDATA